jgi:ribonuclease BN (tRNA processing enzyme)
MGATVRFLGSGDAFGSGGRFQTCIQLRSDDANVLLDCGASSLIAMRRFGVQPADIEAIILSHLHGDHFGGIPFFILDAQFFSPRSSPLFIAGPEGVESRVKEAMEVLFPGSSKTRQKFEIHFIELHDRTPAEVAGVTVTPFEVVHASGAKPFALRVEAGGRTVACSGDTEWSDSLIDAADGVDLLICEAYFFDRQVRFHLDYRTIEANRSRLNCKRLVLTHMNRDMLSRVDEVDAECPEDGLEITL